MAVPFDIDYIYSQLPFGEIPRHASRTAPLSFIAYLVRENPFRKS